MKAQWTYILGKGGVGKSTLARRWHQEQPSSRLITMNDPELHFENCLEDYLAQKIRFRALSHVVLKVTGVKSLLLAAPGVSDLIAIGKIWDIGLKSSIPVIVDMPSTGHALGLLKAPWNFSKLFQSGTFFEDAKKIATDLNDPEKSRFVVVCTPEELPVQETLELIDKLSEILPHQSPEIVVNKIWPGASSEVAISPALVSPTRRDYHEARLRNEETAVLPLKSRNSNLKWLPFEMRQ